MKSEPIPELAPSQKPTLNQRRAEWIYEAARLEAVASGRPIVPELWVERDAAFTAQFITTVARLCDPNAEPTTPEKEHESWTQAYEEMGWRYGPVRSTTAKTHPDMVPFRDLPKTERDKDAVFLALCAFAREFITGEREVLDET